MSAPYDDIINLLHHVSTTRPQMPVANRAAQFSSFAALTGYDAAIKETARRTDEQIELEEDAKAALNLKLRLLVGRIEEHPNIAVTYFRQDGKKGGGAYVTAVDAMKKMDDYERCIVLMGGERISIDDVLDIGCELFDELT